MAERYDGAVAACDFGVSMNHENESTEQKVEEIKDAAADQAENLKDKAEDVYENLKDKAEDAVDAVKHSGVFQKIGEVASNLKDKAEDAMHAAVEKAEEITHRDLNKDGTIGKHE